MAHIYVPEIICTTIRTFFHYIDSKQFCKLKLKKGNLKVKNGNHKGSYKAYLPSIKFPLVPVYTVLVDFQGTDVGESGQTIQQW